VVLLAAGALMPHALRVNFLVGREGNVIRNQLKLIHWLQAAWNQRWSRSVDIDVGLALFEGSYMLQLGYGTIYMSQDHG